MARRSTTAERIIGAALALAAEQGWRRLSLAEIARGAGVSLVDAYATFPTKADILAAIIADTDRQVLAGPPPDLEETPRDRLFDVIMRRFDALAPHKSAVAAVVRDLPGEPLTVLVMLPRVLNGMAWMLEAAGLSSAGFRGFVRTKGLAAVYLASLRVWLEDDTPDMAPTMAELDRGLRRAETILRGCRALVPGGRALRSEAAPPASATGLDSGMPTPS